MISSILNKKVAGESFLLDGPFSPLLPVSNMITNMRQRPLACVIDLRTVDNPPPFT